MAETFWLPMESNPEVVNRYLSRLGVPKKWNVVDVFGLEPEMLEWIPQPVKALILLFPCSEAYEKHRADEDVKLKADPPIIPENLFYMKQVIHNACGTIALVHSIANTEIDLKDGVLKKYLNDSKNLTPEERGKFLESNTEFAAVHEELALQGQTEVPHPEEKINNHFVAFINKDGVLYEMDGRKSFPIKHGRTTAETFVQDAATVCREFMKRDPDEFRFTVIALTAVED